jgi:DNA-binding response OmpR family regulator
MQLLVIEDERRIRSFLAHGFEVEGFHVDATSDGLDGLARAADGHYDLIVLDLLLPGLDGLAVLRELRLSRPDVPVVIVSARTDLPTKLRGFQLGASDYVSKPFSLDELVARIRAQLRRAHGSDQQMEIRAGELVLDLALRQARLDGRAVPLSDREYRLLHHLLQHAGEVVSRERLLSAVWGYHFDPGSNVVDVCVRRVRKKLGPSAPIETVRHAGYRIAAA